MADNEQSGQTQYLDRARKLRATAAEVRDPHVIGALISAAEAYERMATWLGEAGEQGAANAS